MRAVNICLVIICGIQFAAESALAAGVDGMLKSKNGAIYKIVQDREQVVGTYDSPNDDMKAVGIKSGDIAFSGDLIGKILYAQFHIRFGSSD